MSESGALLGQRWDTASQALSRNTSDAEGNERFVDASALPPAPLHTMQTPPVHTALLYSSDTNTRSHECHRSPHWPPTVRHQAAL